MNHTNRKAQTDKFQNGKSYKNVSQRNQCSTDTTVLYSSIATQKTMMIFRFYIKLFRKIGTRELC